MTVSFIRESIERNTIIDSSRLVILQKRVELQRGMSHEILACDIFQDAILTTTSQSPCVVEAYVTPYPVIFTEMNVQNGLANRGPSAANSTVLFKALSSTFSAINFPDKPNVLTLNQFPSTEIGAGPSFSFYTPFVYFTIFIHHEDVDEAVFNDIAFSFMLKVESKKAGVTQYGLGMIRERSVAQGMNLMQQGRTIPKAGNVGQIFPTWKYGGARPERMILGTAARNFWLNYSAEESEAMIDTNNLRTYVKGSRSMDAFDKAFGSDDPVKGPIPDWIRFGLNRGLVSGPIRPQQPPRKLDNNGNTLMF